MDLAYYSRTRGQAIGKRRGATRVAPSRRSRQMGLENHFLRDVDGGPSDWCCKGVVEMFVAVAVFVDRVPIYVVYVVRVPYRHV